MAINAPNKPAMPAATKEITKSTITILRFWALGLCLYQYLDSLRHRLERLNQRYVTMGETLRQRHEELQVNWICLLASRGVQPALIRAVLAPALPPLSPMNC